MRQTRPLYHLRSETLILALPIGSSLGQEQPHLAGILPVVKNDSDTVENTGHFTRLLPTVTLYSI